MPELGMPPFPVTNDAADQVVLRYTEHAAIADLAAVPQLCAAGRPRCGENTRQPSAATVATVGQALSAGEFYDGEPIASSRLAAAATGRHARSALDAADDLTPRPQRITDLVLLLDFTMRMAYQRDLSQRAQVLVLEALADGRLMVIAALSLPVACAELGAETRELTWRIYDRDGSLGVLSPALGAMGPGTAAGGAKTVGDLEVTPVIHQARAATAIVVTYALDRDTGRRINGVDLRP
ncbi:MAG: hypothetical protein JO287_05480 [Pseudonocardiales bacterium]|nr:hypothetical protein [Pseudonocardiales bacterium]